VACRKKGSINRIRNLANVIDSDWVNSSPDHAIDANGFIGLFLPLSDGQRLNRTLFLLDAVGREHPLKIYLNFRDCSPMDGFQIFFTGPAFFFPVRRFCKITDFLLDSQTYTGLYRRILKFLLDSQIFTGFPDLYWTLSTDSQIFTGFPDLYWTVSTDSQIFTGFPDLYWTLSTDSRFLLDSQTYTGPYRRIPKFLLDSRYIYFPVQTVYRWHESKNKSLIIIIIHTL